MGNNGNTQRKVALSTILLLVAALVFGGVRLAAQDARGASATALAAAPAQVPKAKAPTAPVLPPSSANYTFSTASNASLTDMSAGTTQLLGPSTDEGSSTPTNIGFDFAFMGQAYTQFVANANGDMALGSSSTGLGLINDLTQPYPLIAPFWDDEATSATGKVHYKVGGVSPNRVLTIEWKDMKIRYNSTTTDGTYQARLYETTGVIEFVYGAMNVGGGLTTAVTASIGFTFGTTDNTFVAVDNLTAYTVTRLAVNEPATESLVNSSTAGPITALNSSVDGSRRIFTFTPSGPPNPPTNLTFSNVGVSSMTLNWTDSANDTGYAIYKSTDGVSYTLMANLASDTVTYNATGLSANTLYYWRVYALSEGQFSTTLAGSQMTNTAVPLCGTKTIAPPATTRPWAAP